jgi:hypothetical protein
MRQLLMESVEVGSIEIASPSAPQHGRLTRMEALIETSPGLLSARNVTLSDLPVIDKTGLTGNYDLDVNKIMPAAGADSGHGRTASLAVNMAMAGRNTRASRRENSRATFQPYGVTKYRLVFGGR